MDDPVNVTFTYDLFTVNADEIRFDAVSKEIYAEGKLTIDDGQKVKYDGIIKITVKNGKATYEKVDDLLYR